MEIVTFLLIITGVAAISYAVGHSKGFDKGYEFSQDIAIQEEINEDRKRANTIKQIMKALDEIIVMPKETRQAIMLKLYFIIEQREESNKQE